MNHYQINDDGSSALVEAQELKPGDSLAYLTARDGWAFSGHYFSQWENGYLVTRESFACGAIRFTRHSPKGWAVVRGTEVLPL